MNQETLLSDHEEMMNDEFKRKYTSFQEENSDDEEDYCSEIAWPY